MPDVFIPTIENPGRVSFSVDGTMWSCTRDEFHVHRDANGKETYILQALVTRFAKAGDPLPAQTRVLTDEQMALLEAWAEKRSGYGWPAEGRTSSAWPTPDPEIPLEDGDGWQ